MLSAALDYCGCAGASAAGVAVHPSAANGEAYGARKKDDRNVTSESAQREPRERELNRVARAVMDDRDRGRSQLIDIDGPLGIGKSVFLADLLGALVGGGVPADRLLRVTPRHREPGTRLGALRSLLLGVEAPDEAAASGDRELTVQLAERVRGGHDVLAVDDAELLAPDEVEVLSRMILLPSAPPLTLVLVHRGGGSLASVLAAARERGLLHEHVTLEPLTDAAITQLAAGLDPIRRELVLSASSGNPLFARVLSEAFRRYPEAGDAEEALGRIQRDGSDALGAAAAPALETIDHRARRVLDALAIAGERTEAVADLTGLSRASVADAASDLHAAGLLPVPSISALHPVIRYSVALHLDDGERADLTRRAAGLPGITAQERADHLARLAERQTREEAETLVDIGRISCETAPVAVVRWLRSVPQEHIGVEARTVLGRALLRSGEAEAAIEELSLATAPDAAAVGAPSAEASALLAQAEQSAGRRDEATRVLASLRDLPSHAHTAEALREIADASMLIDGAADPRLLGRLYDSSGGEDRLVSRTYEVFALLTEGETAKAQAVFSSLPDQWLLVPDDRLPRCLLPLVFATWSSHVLEQYERCFALSERGIRVSLRHGRADVRSLLHAVRAFALMQLGRLAEADEAAENAVLEAERHGPQGAAALAHSVLVVSAQARAAANRDSEGLRRRYEQLVGAELPQMVWWRRVVLSARSRASAALGMPESSPELIREPVDSMSAVRYTDAARTAARAGNVELAVRLLDQARTIAADQGLRGQLAMVEAQTAEMMLQWGSVLEAKNLLVSAQPVFAEFGMVMMQGHAQTLLALADEALARRSERFGTLSERELQVAELVTAGMKNREISAHLVLSQRTVENHVARILRKLGLDNRHDLVALFDDAQR